MNRYPLWRYLLIVVLVVLGIIYALPNLYGVDYAIQVQPKNNQTLPAKLDQKIAALLKEQNIPYLSIQRKPYSYLIRFKLSEEQLKAQDVVQAVLGKQYTVALNLAPRTPKWLQALGAKPMKLGLDLRGGIHFLLQVNVQAMITKRLSGDIQGVGAQLRDANVRYTGIKKSEEDGFTVRFRNATARKDALPLLEKNYPDYQFQKSVGNGNLVLQAKFKEEALVQIEQNAVKQIVTILRTRVNELGVSEPVIQQQGRDKISVDLPGIQDTARAKSVIGKVATIRLQLQDVSHDAQSAASSGLVPFGSTLYRYEGQPVLLKNRVVLAGTSIVSASAIVGQDGRPAVSIRVGGSGVATFNRITGANIGKPLAVVYVQTQPYKEMVNGKVKLKFRQTERVINVATIQSALGNNFQILGLESMRYAKNLALLLRSGAYPAPVSYVTENTVGPSLGRENIRMGVLSMEFGSLLVILFMALYYRVFGLIADVALVLNVVFVLAIMSILGFTLTLPGIAGIVLTVGMAVDANVLINERIREELRNGVSPHASIYAGYGRAFSTIVDANVTTLIVAVVLFALGTGPVQGFAVTISIGLLCSMVTSIFFTRAIVNLLYGRRPVKQLPLGIKVKTE